VEEFLEEQGLLLQMSMFLKKGAKQQTTDDTNASRLVSKIKWIVESVFFGKVVSSYYIPYIGEFIRSVSAIFNKYRPPLARRNTDGIRGNA
jgi:hypothetical protein